MRQVLLLLGLIFAGAAVADDALTPGIMPGVSTAVPAPATPVITAPAAPVAAAPPPGSTITTVTTTTPVAAAPAPAAAAIPPASASGVATGLAPPAPVGPGGVGMPQSLNPSGGQQTGATAVAPSQMVDPTTFGTLQDPAFQGMTNKIFPMTPDQIRAFRDVYETTKRITAESPRAPPRPLVSSQTISLSPGTVPPLIRLANGYVTSVVFVDDTGAPWPVAAYSIGNPHAFNIQWDTESNLLMIQGQGAYVSGNMAVSLKKLDTPIMLTIVSEQNVVDYRVDFRVQGRGPNANGSMIGSTLPQNNNQLLMNLLDGVPPTDARALEVTGGMGQAWLRGATMFVRTPLTVLSPSWTATMSSPDGTKVYQMNPTPMVLVSDRGRTVALNVKGL